MANSTLPHTLATTKALTSHLLTTLRSPPSTPPPASPAPDDPNTPNPLSLSNTSAKLLKALTTKLTLLSLNTPFSPTAISDILSQASTSPLPALVTSVQLCQPSQYGTFLATELKQRTTALVSAFEKLLSEIPVTEGAQEAKLLAGKISGVGLEREHGEGLGGGGKKDALVGTGLVWEACDELSALCAGELGEVAATKMESWQELMRDAVLELEEWIQDADDEDEDGDANADGEGVKPDSDGEKTISAALRNSHLSTSPTSSSTTSFTSKPSPQTLSAARVTLPLLRHVSLIYPPLIKRRLRHFPPFSSTTPLSSRPPPGLFTRLDAILDVGQRVSETTDAVAEALYEGLADEARERTRLAARIARMGLVAEERNWVGGDDALTTWVAKWVEKEGKLMGLVGGEGGPS